jgi:hypothetical protein
LLHIHLNKYKTNYNIRKKEQSYSAKLYTNVFRIFNNDITYITYSRYVHAVSMGWCEVKTWNSGEILTQVGR